PKSQSAKWIAAIRIRKCFCHGGLRSKGSALTRDSAAQFLRDPVSDPPEPCTNRFYVLERGSFSCEHQESRLRGILRILPVEQQATAQRMDGIDVTPHQDIRGE